MILKTEHKELQFLGGSSGPCVVLQWVLEGKMIWVITAWISLISVLGVRKWQTGVLDTFLILSGTKLSKLPSGCKGLPFLWVVSCSPCKSASSGCNLTAPQVGVTASALTSDIWLKTAGLAIHSPLWFGGKSWILARILWKNLIRSLAKETCGCKSGHTSEMTWPGFPAAFGNNLENQLLSHKRMQD